MSDEERLRQYLRKVTRDLRTAHQRVRELEQREHEPIAIVGMSCRYPDAIASPAELWTAAADGIDAVGGYPEDRGWDLDGLHHPDPGHPGTIASAGGAFLRDISGFDAGFFGIGPREAIALHPQHRLMLELLWEALEDAHIDPTALHGSSAGVYMGVFHDDYGVGPDGAMAVSEQQAQAPGGDSACMLSGRMAYTLGLEGPALSIDTACSSSLVAVHVAATALRRGECELAVAGGITAMATPKLLTGFSRLRVLSPDGRCRSFGAGADGVGMSEGAGLLVLERLSRAREHGHTVLAVLRGTAINQDGASNGLTAPNGPAQERVIRQALADAGLSGSDVDVVEGHGTGTTLGDPIEVQALLATYGAERANGPLRLGSIKSNIGHAQAAAGVAGVIKMVESLQRERLPPSLHCEQPSAQVTWPEGAIALLQDSVDWPRGERPRRAGVSSFGISGTNAHVILEEAPAVEAAPQETVPRSAVPVPVLVSADSDAGLCGQAQRLRNWLTARPALEPIDVACSLATGRAQLECRAAVVGRTREELIGGLDALARGELGPDSARGQARAGKTAFLFTGQGSQWAGMGAELYERFDVFAGALDAVCAEMDPRLGRSLKESMFAAEGSPEAALLDRTERTQVALFAFEVALFALLESWGVKPDFLIGHSVGELVAAHVAGMLSLSDACALVVARGRLMGALPAGGAMLAIEASENEVAETLGELVSIAAINGPRAVVISGEVEAVQALEQLWSERGRRTSRLRVSHAFHSHLMEPMLDELHEVAEGMSTAAPRIPIVSNVTGEVVAERDGAYWARHVREPVRFADGIAELERLGVTRFVEVGPDAALTAMAQGSVSTDLADRALFTAAMRKGRDQEQTLLACLAAMHTAGVTVDWNAFFAPAGAQHVPLPTYAFQRERLWLDPVAGTADVSRAGLGAIDHPLLGAMLPLPHDGGAVFSGRVALATHPWLRDHAVAGTVLLPGTAFVDVALTVADQLGASGVEELTLAAPLLLDEQEPVSLQVHVTAPDSAGCRTIEIRSCRDDDDWTEHASGVLAAAGPELAVPSVAAILPPASAREVDVDLFYDNLAEAGYEYGPAFQNVRRVYQSGETWFAELALSDAEQSEAARFRLHPALTDAALQVSLLAAPDGATLVPFSFTGVRMLGEGAVSLHVRIEAKAAEGEAMVVALAGADASGATAFVIDGVEARPADLGVLRARPRAEADGLLVVRWVEHDADGADVPPLGSVAVVEQDDTALGAGLAEAMGLDRHADLAALGRAIADGVPAPDVVLVRAPAAIASVLELLQAWLAVEALADARLVLLTEQALAVDGGEAPNLAQAAVPGLVRSAVSEHPLRFGLLDLGAGDVGVALRAALACGEPEVAVREGRVLVPRFARAAAGGALIPPGAGGWQLGVERAGSLDGLALLASDVDSPSAAALGPGEVRIAVQAAGLNFRDVLVALGQYPEPSALGAEGAGIVVETAPDVSHIAVGDRVMGMMAGAFGPAVVTDARLVAQVPDGWSPEEAAAVPTVFLTALYGLVDVADLQRGERILVHGGAGGVGMAAIQIAQQLGAEVFATAHPDKWEVLRGLGLDDEHIASSRDLGFRDAFDRVDVVLDSLAGEFVDASLALLGDGGRFVEIGKADVRDAGEVAVAHPGVTYTAFDLMEAGRERLQAMLAELVERFAAGTCHHLPISTWDVRRAPDAFRFMREAKHVGKIVLTIPQPPDPHGAVLITGGTGGLGALVARHLAGEHGVQRLVLTSRRGPEAAGATELVAELAELGCDAQVVACDVADRAQVQALLADLPLTGIVHAAGVLDDGTITSLDADRLRAVMAPKVDGALHLHELTADHELSFFILFSSAAAAFGSPGQGNYAAANGFLDALAHHRQAHGLPATSIAWGPWEQSGGMVTDADAARFARLGALPLANEQGLRLLDIARGAAQPHLLPLRLDRAALRAQATAGVLPPIASELVRASVRRAEGQASLAGMLAGASEPEWPRIALDLVRSHVAAVLGHPSPQAVDPDKSFKDMGFDSLAAVELRNRLVQATGLRLPSTVVFDHPTPTLAAAYLLTKATPGTSGRAAVDEELDRLEGLLRSVRSEDADRVRRRLRSMLSGMGEDTDRDLAVMTEQKIEAASADEILELVSEELEKSYEGLERS